jgi:CheY-like chemotaxis protein
MFEKASLAGVTLEEAYLLAHPKRTVLVVEDDFDVLSSIAEVIRDEGYHVITAANGYQALAQVEEEDPDLIFLDLMMPQMDGWSFVAELRRRFPGKKTPIILMSAVERLVQEAASLGIKYYLRKPFRLEEIARIASECCPRNLFSPNNARDRSC